MRECALNKISRNDPCPCGSGKKYKLCCERKAPGAASNPRSRVDLPAMLQQAIAHHQAGSLAQADTLYGQILQVQPDHADALNLSGLVAHQRGDADRALGFIARAIEVRPAEHSYYYNLGVVLQARTRAEEAAVCYRQALVLKPDYIEVYPNLGVVLQVLGRLDEAVACYRQALQIKPDYAEAYSNLGLALQALHRTGEAIACYRQALSIKPDYAEAHSNLGVALEAQGRPDEAIASYRQALSIKPDYVKAHSNLGVALQAQGRAEDAIASYQQALSIEPDYVDAHINLGVALQAHDRSDEAITSYRQALQVKPDFADARFNLALALLHRGYFEEGWQCYEARFDKNKTQRTTEIPALSFPRWQGEDVRGKSIVIWPEQGMGDEIQSMRYVSLLKSAGAARVTVVCKVPLKALFHSVPGVDAVIDETEAQELAAHDFWEFQMSLPLRFATDLATIPSALPYLAADKTKQRSWSDRLPASGVKVGLVWKGSATHKNDANRSLSGLAQLAPLWSVPGVTFVSLQKGQGEDEAADPPAGQPLLHLGSRIEDFSDAAAIVSQLDLVICVDTGIAHLAGALGTPCWVLLPAIGTDWRWLMAREDSPWYPGALRLFRQTAGKDWPRAVGRMVEALANFSRLAAQPVGAD